MVFHSQGSKTLFIPCTTPLVVTISVIAISESVMFEIPLILAPPASLIVTFPPWAVAGCAPSVRPEENTLAAITWYNKIFFKVFG